MDRTRGNLTTGQAAAEMVTFGGPPHSEVSQSFSRDIKYNGRETTTCELANLYVPRTPTHPFFQSTVMKNGPQSANIDGWDSGEGLN